MPKLYRTDQNGKLIAEISLGYDTKIVHPVGVADELPGVKGTTNLGFGNHTVFGLLLTDKTGKPFGLGLRSGTSQLAGNGTRLEVKLTLELQRDRNATDPPDTIAFWGTRSRHIEVPVSLKDVPLSAGK